MQCTCCTVPTISGRPHGSLLVWPCQWPSFKPLSTPQLPHNDNLWAYREAKRLSWCPSCPNIRCQGGSCGLMYCPGGNSTNPIWRVLASSDGISSWTHLKHQHSNPNPNPLANQVWCIEFLTPPTPLIILCIPRISYATQKLILDSCKMVEKHSGPFHTFLWHFFQVFCISLI